MNVKWRRRRIIASIRLRSAWYQARYGIRIYALGGHGASMAPKLGRGKYVSVYQRGPFLDIVDERAEGQEFIRLVPYQPNHGLMVEFWQDGTMRWRSHCDYRMLRKLGIGEALADREEAGR